MSDAVNGAIPANSRLIPGESAALNRCNYLLSSRRSLARTRNLRLIVSPGMSHS